MKKSDLVGRTFRKVPKFWVDYGSSSKEMTITKVGSEVSLTIDENGHEYPLVTSYLYSLLDSGAVKEVR